MSDESVYMVIMISGNNLYLCLHYGPYFYNRVIHYTGISLLKEELWNDDWRKSRERKIRGEYKY